MDDIKTMLFEEAKHRTGLDVKPIKDFLFNESMTRTGGDVKEIKKILLKEALSQLESPARTLEDIIKENILLDNILHLASIKEGMAALTGSSYYQGASNISVQEFPYEEHKRIQGIKKKVSEKFAPLLLQRFRTQKKWTKIDLSELGIEPFYIRLAFRKHLLPQENKDQILNELESLAPGLSELTKDFDAKDIPVLPYFNQHCKQGGPGKKNAKATSKYFEAAKSWATGVQSMMQAPVPTAAGQPNFLAQNPRLKEYWDRMVATMEKDKNFLPFYEVLWRSTYENAVRVPVEQMGDVKERSSLLWATHYVENNEKQTLYRESMEDSDNVKKAWEDFVSGQIEAEMKEKYGDEPDDKIKVLYQNKAKQMTDKIWNIFGVIPPYVRNMNMKLNPENVALLNEYLSKLDESIQPGVAGKLNSPGATLPPYDRLTLDDLKMLLTFLKASSNELPGDIRFNASPIKWPNGIDFEHIYPPVSFAGGEYELDVDRGNMGTNYLRHHGLKLLASDGPLTGKADQIDQIYAALAGSDHKVMASHTSADNLLLFLQSLSEKGDWELSSNISTPQISQIKHNYGVEADAILKFMSNLQGSKTTQLNEQMMTYGPALYKRMTDLGDDGVARGYKLAKILDIIHHTILKNLPDAIYGVSGRNYSTGGVSGELMLAVKYAYSVEPMTDIAGGKKENYDALKAIEETMPPGGRAEQVRKTHHYEKIPEGETLTMAPEKTPMTPQGDARIVPELSYFVGQKTGKILRPTKGSQIYNTLEEALSFIISKYPQCEDFINEKLNLLGLRMDYATQQIRDAVYQAINLAQAQINQETGGLMGESGQTIEQEKAQLDQEMESTKSILKKEDKNYAKYMAEEPEAEETLLDMGAMEDEYLMEQIGQKNQIAKAVVEVLLNSNRYDLLAKLYKTQYVGKKIEDTLATGMSIDQFFQWVESPEFPYYPGTATPEQLDELSPGEAVPPPGFNIGGKESSTVSRLVKLANYFDKKGHTKIANKIDLLIAKLGEEEE